VGDCYYKTGKKRMHVCLVTGIFPPDIGGPATYVSRLAFALYQQNHIVCVITLGEDLPEYPFPVKKVSRTYPLVLRFVMLFVVLIRCGWRSDVWYINGLELPAVLAGKLLRKRMIMKVVGDYAWERAMDKILTSDTIDAFQSKPQYWKVELHKKLRAWLARQVHTLIVPSVYLKTLVCDWGVSEQRVQVIYNAIEDVPDIPGTKSELRCQLGFSEQDKLLITVGRLVAWKGIDRLIQILVHLDESIKLVIIGDGPEKNKLTDLATYLNVTHRVKLTGKLERRKVFSYLKAADVFVLNSAYEGLPHVVLEAMRVGIPVVATNVGGNPELIVPQENGILVTYGDIEELSQQITTGLHDTQLRKTLIEGGKRTVQRYSWDGLLQQTMGILCGH
jgi:glycosyltransferase involved in cell wall biosynthesis